MDHLLASYHYSISSFGLAQGRFLAIICPGIYIQGGIAIIALNLGFAK